MNTSDILNDALAVGGGISITHVILIILITIVAVVALVTLCNGFLFSVMKALKKLFSKKDQGDSDE